MSIFKKRRVTVDIISPIISYIIIVNIYLITDPGQNRKYTGLGHTLKLIVCYTFLLKLFSISDLS